MKSKSKVINCGLLPVGAGYGPGKHRVQLTIMLETTDRIKKNWHTLYPVECGAPIFSICVDVYKGRELVGFGQMIDEFKQYFLHVPLYKEVLSLWKKYHSHDMKAGTKAQTKLQKQFTGGGEYDFRAVQDHLKNHNLLYDRGYEYGTDWLYMPIAPNHLKQINDILA